MKNFLTIFIAFTFCFNLIIKQTVGQTIKCKLWNTNDYSKLPDSLKLPGKISCQVCSWKCKTGEEINKKGKFTAVRLTFSNLKDTSFYLKSKFKNISLIKKGGNKIQHPFALLWNDMKYDAKKKQEVPFIGYMLNNIKAINYIVTVNPKEKNDLIFLFKNAEVGDIIVIDNFIKAEITE